MLLGISSSVVRAKSSLQAPRLIAEAGFDAMELAYVHLEPLMADAGLCKEWPAMMAETGLKSWSVHLPFFGSVDIGNYNPAIRRHSVSYTKQCIEKALELGFPLGILHPGSWIGHKKSERVDDYAEKVIQSVKELAEFAEANGFRLAVENMLGGRKAFEFGPKVEDLARVVREVASPHVGICVDVGHFAYSQYSAGQGIRELGPNLFSLHIQSNDGKGDLHWTPMTGVIDWEDLAKALVESGYQGVLMSESIRTPSGETEEVALRESFENLKQFSELIIKHAP